MQHQKSYTVAREWFWSVGFRLLARNRRSFNSRKVGGNRRGEQHFAGWQADEEANGALTKVTIMFSRNRTSRYMRFVDPATMQTTQWRKWGYNFRDHGKLLREFASAAKRVQVVE